MLAVGVIQMDPAADPSAALASVTAERAYLLRPRECPGEPPDSVEVLPMDAGDRIGAARLVRAACGMGRIVVLRAGESLSPDLATDLSAREHDADRPRSYRASVQVRFLGRHLSALPVVLAWDGDPDSSAAVVQCQGRLVVRLGNLCREIAELDTRAVMAAARRDQVAAGEFLWRPAWSLARRAWRRRHEGTPGMILSVLETYGEVLVAAKVWEVASARRRGLPAGFVRLDTPTGVVVIREELGAELERILMAATPDAVEGGRLVNAGRGATWALRVAGAPPAMLRWYRRGGLPSRIARDSFVSGGKPRPIRELDVTEKARARGIPVPEVLGVRVERHGLGRYRGAIVTREIEDVAALSGLISAVPEPVQCKLLRTTARVIRRMHDRGLHHPDLNAGNVLLRTRDDRCEGFIIDLDRARMRASLSRGRRQRALHRLDRSLKRIEGVTAEARATLQRTYWEAG